MQINAGANTLNIQLASAPGATGANGRVVDPFAQNGVAGVMVSIGGVKTYTNASGYWYLWGITPGSQVIRYSKQGFADHVTWAINFVAGQNNGVGSQAIMPITNNYVDIAVIGPISTLWGILLKDASGKIGVMANIPWGSAQRFYVPDNWVWPATLMCYADILINTNTATQTGMVQSWGSDWGSIYNPNAIITGVGVWSINLSTGTVTKMG